MASLIQPPIINGHRHDFTSIQFHVGPIRLFELKELNYKHRLTPGMVRGTGSPVLGRTRGIYDADGSFTMYKSEYQNLIEALIAEGAAQDLGYMEVPFDIFAIYSERGSTTIKDVCAGCRITDDEDGHSEGSDALVVRATLNIMRLIRAGRVPVTGISPTGI
jgi:hypothetical protein